MIIGHFEHRGLVEPKDLYDNPSYIVFHLGGIGGLFESDDTMKIVHIVDDINSKASV